MKKESQAMCTIALRTNLPYSCIDCIFYSKDSCMHKYREYKDPENKACVFFRMVSQTTHKI